VARRKLKSARAADVDAGSDGPPERMFNTGIPGDEPRGTLESTSRTQRDSANASNVSVVLSVSVAQRVRVQTGRTNKQFLVQMPRGIVVVRD
jgi:hypothetical protein